MWLGLLALTVVTFGLVAAGCEATPSPTVAPAKPTGVETVQLRTQDGVNIAASFYAPPKSGAAGVVLVHMVGRNRGDWADLAGELQAAGYAVLAIDLRGHGESGGSKAWTKMTADVEAAVDFLRRQGDTDATRIGIVGASIGANLALVVAAADPQVKTVVLLSPGLDYRGVQTEEAMRAYGQRPALIVASQEDGYATDSSRTLDGLAQGKHQLKIYKGAGHGTRMFGPEPGLADLIAQWLDETL